MSRVDAIVYTSNAGHSKEYAEIIASETGLKAYELSEAKSALEKGATILYIGWVMGSGIKGYKKAIKQFRVAGLCAVGMTPQGARDEEFKEKNNVPDGRKFFYLQGGFEMDKVSGMDKTIMKAVSKKMRDSFGDKEEKTEGELDVLEQINEGANRVSKDKAQVVIDWINS